jgi:hypothetical protein
VIDQTRDGYGDVAMADNDENGLFEAMIADPGQDGTIEMYARDTNNDGAADTWFTAAPRPAGGVPTLAPQSLGGFYNQWYANMLNFAPVFANGVSAFGNALNPLPH